MVQRVTLHTSEAFLTFPQGFQSSFTSTFPRATTPRRIRLYSHGTHHITPHARSLESYREGRRKFNSRTPRYVRGENSFTSKDRSSKSSSDTDVRKPKTWVALTSALSQLSVASTETCGFLVRSGCVYVNGLPERNDKAKVHRYRDDIVVNGKEYGTLHRALRSQNEEVEEESSEEDEMELLPRRQRDFPISSRNAMQAENIKKYNRKVDRGFYSSREYRAGKH